MYLNSSMTRRRTVGVETPGGVPLVPPRNGRQQSQRSTSTQHRHTSRRVFLSSAQTAQLKKIPRFRQLQTDTRTTTKLRNLQQNMMPSIRVRPKSLPQNMMLIIRVSQKSLLQNMMPIAQAKQKNLRQNMTPIARIKQKSLRQNMTPMERVKQKNLRQNMMLIAQVNRRNPPPNTKKKIIQNLPYRRSPPPKVEM